MDRETRLHLALDMLKEVIERDVEVPLKTFGLSMRPSIHGGEWVVVRRAEAEEIDRGDIVIYQMANTFVAHRVIRKHCREGRLTFTVKGDAHLAADGEIEADAVVARVIALRRGGQTIDLSRSRWRVASKLVARYSSWVDTVYRSLPVLQGTLRRGSRRPSNHLASQLISGLNRLPAKLLMGSWEVAAKQGQHAEGGSPLHVGERDGSRESLCLLRCVRTQMTEDDTRLVHQLCTEGLDWEWIARLAVQNRVGPLLYRSLRETGISTSVPVQARRVLERSYHQGLSRSVSYEPAVREILSRLREEGIQGILLRGLALGEIVYGDPVLRPFTDMDLLIRRQDLAKVRRALFDLGYGPVPGALDDRYYERIHLHLQYLKRESGAVAEVHWALDHKYTVFNINYTEIIEGATQGELAGVTALILTPETRLLSLCVHLTKHCYYGDYLLEQPDFVDLVLSSGLLILYCDIAEVIRHYGADLDWDLALHKARKWQIESSVRPALASVVRLFDAPVPDTVLRSLPSPKTGWLQKRILASAGKDGPEEGARIAPMTSLGRIPALHTDLMFRPVRLLDLTRYLWPPRQFIATRYGVENPLTVSACRGFHIGKTICGLFLDLAYLVYFSRIRRRQ